MKINTLRPFKPFNRLAAPTLTQQVASIFSKYPTAQGAWYDVSDFRTLFQDSSGTVPVTGVGQPVGLHLDKSGLGNHRHQPTTAARPILRQDSGGRYYLEADGVDDCLYTPSIVDLSGSDEVTVCVGLQNARATIAAVFLELSSNYASNSGTFSMFAPAQSSENVFFSSSGTSNANVRADLMLNARAVITGQGKISADACLMRISGKQVGTSAADQGSGGYGAYPLFFFRRANVNNTFQGRDYGTLILGKLLSGSELTAVERWAAQKCGVTL